jgi:hypothetical protein
VRPGGGGAGGGGVVSANVGRGGLACEGEDSGDMWRR